jgi:hypothetical protein
MKVASQEQYSKLAFRLRRAIAQLEEAQEELAGMESLWGGPPSRVNITRYEHDPVAWGDLVRARSRYAHLLEERVRLRGLVATLQRKLKEVAG